MSGSPLPKLPSNPLGPAPKAPSGSPFGPAPRPPRLLVGTFGRRAPGGGHSPLPPVGRKPTAQEVASGAAPAPAAPPAKAQPAQVIRIEDRRPVEEAPKRKPLGAAEQEHLSPADERSHVHAIAHERIRGFLQHLPADHQRDARVYASDALNRWADAYRENGLQAARSLRERPKPEGDVGPKVRDAARNANAPATSPGGMERMMKQMPPEQEVSKGPPPGHATRVRDIRRMLGYDDKTESEQ